MNTYISRSRKIIGKLKSEQIFRGTGVAMVTPFKEDGDIDWKTLKNHIAFLTKGKLDYLVVMGTTAENVTLSKEEKQKVFSFVAEHNDGSLPLMAGIGGNSTQEVLDALQKTDLTGYHGILSVSPYYNKPNQEGLYQHYKMVSEVSSLPVVMYNVPGRTGMNVSAETTVRIAHDCPNIIATKEASGNFEQIMYIIKHSPESFNVISGDDGIALPMIALGASGVISVIANAFPEFSNMIRLALMGEFEKARVEHYKYTDIIQTLFTEGSPSGIKAYMSDLGLCKENFRLPVYAVSHSLRLRIKELLSDYKKG